MVCDLYENDEGIMGAINFIEVYNNFQLKEDHKIKNENHKKKVKDLFDKISDDLRWTKGYINSSQINGARLTGQKFPKRLDGKWILDNGKVNEYISKKHIQNKKLFTNEINEKNKKTYISTVKGILIDYDKYNELVNLCGDPFTKEDNNGMKLKCINEIIINKKLSEICKTNTIKNSLKRFWAIINNMN
jgi:hypothetical protein